MGLKIWKWEVCTNCVRALLDRTRHFLNYFHLRRLHRKLRGPSPASYEAAGYESSGPEYTTSERDLAYWVLELRHIKTPQFEWVPWAVLKFGAIRDHLTLAEKIAYQVAGVEDARVRRITLQEALRLERNGISVWRKGTN